MMSNPNHEVGEDIIPVVKSWGKRKIGDVGNVRCDGECGPRVPEQISAREGAFVRTRCSWIQMKNSIDCKIEAKEYG